MSELTEQGYAAARTPAGEVIPLRSPAGVCQTYPSPNEGVCLTYPLEEPATPSRELKVTWADRIEPEPVDWAWQDNGQGRIPAGALCIAAGREGTGKSSFGIWQAARISRGTLPGIFYGQPRNVFYVAVEDSWAHTLVPRLIAAGADLSRIGRLDAVEDEGRESILCLPTDLSLLEQAILDEDVALVILDPLLSLFGKGLDSHREQDTRRALDPLAKIADRTGAVILGIAHLNKSAGGDAATRITGSGAFKNVPRAVFGFAKDDDGRVMTQVKNSLGLDGLPSLAYNIETAMVPTLSGTAETGRFVFCGESDRTVDDMLRDANSGEDHSERNDAAAWMTDYLTQQGGTAPSKEVTAAGVKEGYSKRTLQRARGKAGILTASSGYPRTTTWSLPPVAPQSCQSRQGPERGTTGATDGATESPSSDHSTCTVCGDPLIPSDGATTHPTCQPPGATS